MKDGWPKNPILEETGSTGSLIRVVTTTTPSPAQPMKEIWGSLPQEVGRPLLAPLLPPGLGLCLSWAEKSEKNSSSYVDL